jgi:Phage integrase family
MLRVPPRRIGRARYRSGLRVALVVVAVAHRRLGPSSSATTSTVEPALPSSAVQLRCWSRPTTTTRLPLARDCAACSAWSRHTSTVKNDASCSRRPDTATRKLALAGARIHVVEQAAEVAGKFIESPPKTLAGQRVVVLPAVAVAALAEHLDEFAAPGPNGLVFPSGRGTYLQRSNFSRLVWRPAVHQLGLDGLRFHDLRHTAATLAAAAGATTRELMERMGHTSPAVALRYQHVMADRQGAIAAALDGLAREAENGRRRRPRARRGHDRPRRGSGREGGRLVTCASGWSGRRCARSGHRNGVSRDIGMGWRSQSGDVQGTSCDFRRRR